MIMKYSEIEFKSDKSNVDEMPYLEDYNDVEITYPVERKALVMSKNQFTPIT